MIWLLHKVDKRALTPQWVTVDFFETCLQTIHKQGLKVVTLAEYTNSSNEVVITFDDVYANVYQYAFPLLKKFGYPFELFVVGSLVGKTNEFDWPEPAASFATAEQLREMSQNGGVLEYHSWSHLDLRQLDDTVLEQEIKPQFGAKFFAYPYGLFDQRVEQAVKKYYQGAVAVQIGDNSQWELLRGPLWEKSASSFLATIMGRIWQKLLRVF